MAFLGFPKSFNLSTIPSDATRINSLAIYCGFNPAFISQVINKTVEIIATSGAEYATVLGSYSTETVNSFVCKIDRRAENSGDVATFIDGCLSQIFLPSVEQEYLGNLPYF